MTRTSFIKNITGSGSPTAKFTKFALPVVWFTAFLLLYNSNLQEPENSLKYGFLAASAALVAILYFFKKPPIIYLPKGGGYYWWLGILATSLMATLYAINKGDALYEWSKVFLQFSLFLYLFNLLIKAEQIIRTLFVCAAVAVVAMFVVVLLQLNAISSETDYTIFSAQAARFLHATFSNKNFFAEAMLCLLPFCVLPIFGNNKAALKVVSIIVTALAVCLILMTKSMSSFAGLLVFFSTFLLLQLLIKSSGRKLIILLIAGGLGLVFVFLTTTQTDNIYVEKIRKIAHYLSHPEEIKNIPSRANDNSVYERLLLYSNSLDMIRDYPVLGCGLSNWKLLFPLYGITGTPLLASGRMRYEHPHNEFLFVFCETGLLGFIAFTGLLLHVLISGFRNIRKDPGNTLLIAAVSGIVAFIVIAMFGYPRERCVTAFLFTLMISIVFAADKLKIKNVKNRSGLSFAFLVILIITLLLHGKKIQSETRFVAVTVAKQNNEYIKMRRAADKAYSSLFPLDLTSTPIKWYAGMASFYSGDSVTALKYYEEALESNPYHLQLWTDLAAVQEKNGLLSGARASINRALEISPEYPKAIYNAGIIHYKLGDRDSALFYMYSYPYKKSVPYKKTLSKILANEVGEFLRKTQDTVLVNRLNDSIKANHYFLVDRFLKANGNANVMFHRLK